MKKSRGRSDKDGKDNSGSGSKGSNDDKDKTVAKTESIDDENANQGFGAWLRSSDGVEMMRLFVIANSVVVFVTMAWPNMQETFYILKDMIMGESDED